MSRPLSAGMQTILAKSNLIAMFIGDARGFIREANDAYLRVARPHPRGAELRATVRWKETMAPEQPHLG